MTNHLLSPDTQAMLLLSASFGLSRTTEPQPLSLGEYNDLASWLKDNNLTPKDLLDSKTQNKLVKLVINKLESDRILTLLERGVMLSLAVEKWTNQGLWILGRGDAEYPKCLKQKLRYQAPAIIYGVGNKKLLSQGGLAIVGSRDVDDAGLEYTQKLAQTCAQQKIQIISGGARGVDRASMLNVLEAGGTAVGVIADSLAKAAVAKNYRTEIKEGRLTIISTYDPDAGFNIGNAMGRNKYIYALADYSLVVSSSVSTGGTWAGAIEALKKIQDVPVLVRIEENVPKGNHELIKEGAIPFPQTPWNLSLTKLIDDRILEFKSNQKNEGLVEQLSIFYPINISPANIQDKIEDSTIKIQDNPQDIYEAVLPVILQNLRQPKDEKSLAECLDVQLGQLRLWLKKAVDRGEVKKNKNPVTYEISQNTNYSEVLPKV
jgi:predicted Rossmann fold nucleotide-binding protein DprA/Smf involved in DNA uptake